MEGHGESSGSSAGWDRVDHLLYAWLERPADEFDARLDALRCDDPALAEAVASRVDRMRRLGWLPGPGGDAPATDRPFGEYRILRPLGVGGMGEVYLAEQPALNRRVALKLIRSDRLQQPGARERFQREARAAADLRHPGICAVLDVGEVDGRPYLAMQYVDGQTLAERIAAQRDDLAGRDGQSRPPSTHAEIAAVLEVAEKIARSLHEAHEAGIVHRDIKPANVMIDPRGEPVVLDFGLARDDASDDELTLTRTGDLVGTPAYMSPEQVRPRGRTIDRRTDVYSLGVTLYECLTFERPFLASTQAGLYERIERDPTPDPRRRNANLSTDAVAVIARAMEKEPARRYATAAEFADDLGRLRRREPVRAKRIGALGRARRWARRNPVAAALIAALALGLTSTSVLLRARAAAVTSLRAQGLIGASLDARETHPMRSLLLARAADRAESSPSTLRELQAALVGCQDVNFVAAEQHGVWSAIWSSDGERILTRGADAFALLLDRDGAELARLGDGSAQIWATEIGPGEDGPVLVAHQNGRVFLYDRDGAPIGGLLQNPVGLGCACLTADGQHVLTGGADGVVRMLSRTGEVERTFAPNPDAAGADFAGVGHLEVSGDQLLAADYLGYASLWNLATGDVERIHHPAGPLATARLQPGRSEARPKVVIVPRRGDPWLWQPGSTNEPRPRPLVGHRLSLYGAVWAPDGSRFCTFGWDPRPIVWSEDGELLHRLTGTGVWSADFDAEGRVVVPSFSGAVRVHDQAGDVLATLRGHAASVDSVAFSPDGTQVLSASQDDTVGIWELSDLTDRTLGGHPADVILVEALSDDRALTVALDGSCFLWERNGHRTLSLDPSDGQPTGLSVGADGLVVRTDRSRQIRLTDLDGTPRGAIQLADEVSCAWPVTDGLVSVTWGTPPLHAKVQVWRDEGGAWRPQPAFACGGMGRIATTHASADATVILLAWNDGTWLRLRRDGADLTESARGRFGGATLQSASLSADGARVVVCHSDGTARLIDADGTETVLRGHESQVSSAMFSPSGDRVLTTSRDGSCALWSAAGELEQLIPAGFGDANTGVFTPDGTRVLVGYADGAARYWIVDPDALRTAADAAVGRDFTQRELERYADLLVR